MKAKSDKGQQPDYLSDNGLSESTAYRAKKCRRGNVNFIPTIINISKKKKKRVQHKYTSAWPYAQSDYPGDFATQSSLKTQQTFLGDC